MLLMLLVLEAVLGTIAVVAAIIVERACTGLSVPEPGTPRAGYCAALPPHAAAWPLLIGVPCLLALVAVPALWHRGRLLFATSVALCLLPIANVAVVGLLPAYQAWS